jgi:hypothetical protein
MLRPALAGGPANADGTRGGRPSGDPVIGPFSEASPPSWPDGIPAAEGSRRGPENCARFVAPSCSRKTPDISTCSTAFTCSFTHSEWRRATNSAALCLVAATFFLSGSCDGCDPCFVGPLCDDNSFQDASVDAASDAAVDSGVDTDTGNCDPAIYGTVWDDAISGLSWQNFSSDTCVPALRSWRGAMEYCNTLLLAGNDDWRLPTVDEFRSLIRGCAATITGGPCGVNNSCLDSKCWDWAECGCSYMGGPGTGGCYWDQALAGSCQPYWSACPVDDSGGNNEHWAANFQYGNVFPGGFQRFFVRCVRPLGPRSVRLNP